MPWIGSKYSSLICIFIIVLNSSTIIQRKQISITKKKNEPLFSWGWGYHAYMITIIRRKQIHNKEAWAIVLMMIPYNIYDINCLKSWLKITFLVILSNVCNKHYPLLFIAHILTQIFDFGIKPRMCVSRWC